MLKPALLADQEPILDEALHAVAILILDTRLSDQRLQEYKITLIGYQSNTIGDFSFAQLLEALRRIRERWRDLEHLPLPCHIMDTISQG